MTANKPTYKPEPVTADQLFFDQLERTWLDDKQLVAQARANPIENHRLVFNGVFMRSIVGRMDDNADLFRQSPRRRAFPLGRHGALPRAGVHSGPSGTEHVHSLDAAHDAGRAL